MTDQLRTFSRSYDSSLSDSADWNSARAFLGERIRRRLHWLPEADIEDVTQESLIRFRRAVSQNAPRNPEALAEIIAERASYAHLRRIYRERRLSRSLELGDEQIASDAVLDLDVDRVARLVFAITNFLQEANAPCLPLFQAYIRHEHSWREVARQLGRTDVWVRTTWHRCQAKIKQHFGGDFDSFLRSSGGRDG